MTNTQRYLAAINNRTTRVNFTKRTHTRLNFSRITNDFCNVSKTTETHAFLLITHFNHRMRDFTVNVFVSSDYPTILPTFL